MAELRKRIYYFKLSGRKAYYFKVDFETFRGIDILLLTCLNNRVEVPLTRDLLEKILNEYMREYSLKYEELTGDELEKVRLFYEV